MDFKELCKIVATKSALSALRTRTRLQPVGGVGDVVYPPTYADGSTRHTRIIGGKQIDCVLLDSVASQANRMEEALRDHTEIPRLAVQIDEYKVTSLDAPHRFTDVILRSCEGYPAEALEKRDQKQIFEHAPQSLLMGCWHSNRKGASGIRIPRAITSEIVAINVADSPHVASRTDPLPFSKSSKVQLDDSVAGWKYGGKDTIKPSKVLLGNIPPSIESERGVTFEYAEQTCVISLPAIRNLEVDDASKAALVAIGLAGYQLAFANGCWLRSRCHLVPEKPPVWESVSSEVEQLSSLDATKLLGDASDAVKELWAVGEKGETILEPTADLTKLVTEGKAALGTKTAVGENEGDK